MGRALASFAGTPAGLFKMSGPTLLTIPGIGRARASMILAAAELQRRNQDHDLFDRKTPFSPEGFRRWVHRRLAHLDLEEFHIFTFNRDYHILGHHRIAVGDEKGVVFSMRKFIQWGLNDGARNILLAHNHPLGPAMASPEDLELMERLELVLEPLGIVLMDQYITGIGGVYSCRDQTCWPVSVRGEK